MNLNTSDLTITSIETITAFDINTGDFKFSLDELQTATIAQGQDVVEITGKQGRRLNTLKRNKTVTISGTNGLLSTGLIEMQAGTPFEEGESTVRITEYLTVESNKATTKYKAVGTAGNELKKVLFTTIMAHLARLLLRMPLPPRASLPTTPKPRKLPSMRVKSRTALKSLFSMTARLMPAPRPI